MYRLSGSLLPMQQAFAPDAVTFWGKCSKHFIRELACRNGKARLSVSLRR
ncbi:hypothetical protein M068_0129 [Bacteroides fragilis str. J38-1]|nr:hypothetical protein M068_0129 [Bacteroides fragilis str. J38-1]